MKVFLIAIALLQTPIVTEVDSIDTCRAMLKDIKVEAVLNDAASVSQHGDTLTVITQDYQTTNYYCGKGQ